MKNNPLLQLKEHGQSVWLDNLSRPLLTEKRLRQLIDDDGISGITSNPAIFEKAMTGSDAYDQQLAELKGKPTKEVFEALAIADIRGACDELRSVFEESKGTDGFVSLEVSPYLARDTKGTLEEAIRLWKTVDRPNVMIKIPGTKEGIPAIEAALTEGLNVNVTLLFSLKIYREVMNAYLNALETRLEKGEPLSSVASVASFFLSRIDSKMDSMLDDPKYDDRATGIRGKTAVASGKLAYHLWKELFSGDRWEKLEKAGGRVQKPLWASTSTKNPEYPDVKYVEPLIGRNTINTMPDETIAAFRDHGMVRESVEDGIDEAGQVMGKIAKLGISIDQVTDELVEEGIDKFIKPFDKLTKALEEKSVGCRAADEEDHRGYLYL